MASFETLPIVDLNLEDVDAGLKLSDEANWNQTAKDWGVFIRHGKTVGFREAGGNLIATAAALPYERALGFIGMVLVTRKWRRRGLATRLMDFCIRWLSNQQRVPVLDATGEGAKVYRRQGFEPLFELSRWRRDSGQRDFGQRDFGQPVRPAPEPVENNPQNQHLADLVRLDAGAVGAPRAFLIEDFISRAGTRTFFSTDRSAFAMVRSGRRAAQIGPVVATSPNAAIRLVSRALGGLPGPVFVDVPTMATHLSAWLVANGFTRQRGFVRMALGQNQSFGNTSALMAAAGPEFG